MGEYADDLIDEGMCGSYNDPFDPNREEMEQDEDFFYPHGHREPREIACRYCNKHGLYWRETEGGWRLADDRGNLHKCRSTIRTENVTF